MIIKNEQVINQLEDLREHCYSMADKTDGRVLEDDIWHKDLLALDIAIKELKRKAPRDCNPIRAIKKLYDSIITYRRK